MKSDIIHQDIKLSHTLPADYYTDSGIHDKIKERLFSKSWLYAVDSDKIVDAGDVLPLDFMPNLFNEPLLFTKDKENKVHCLSNVCTHRGNILVPESNNKKSLSCSYHGRCFELNGKFKSMPSFKEVQDFPSEKDDLPKISFAEWMNMLFVSLDPQLDFERMIKPIADRLSFLPLDKFVFDQQKSKDYFLDANWILYCDNYLEGFHIPFVHPALNASLAFDEYKYEKFDYCFLQLGVAKEGETCFDLPKDHVDYGKNIYAYYFFLFPNLMLNFYPWGLSMNIVYPLSVQKTKVSFRTYVLPNVTHQFDAKGIHDTEMEDEAIVLNVQRGVQSRFYDRGRYSAKMEKGVHWFHGMLTDQYVRK